MPDRELVVASLPAAPPDRPRDDELDLFGLTHRGKVRKENQDHFLLATLHRELVIHGTNLPEPGRIETRSERLATVMLVADGVGGGDAGGAASQLATEFITRYVTSTMQCLHLTGSVNFDELTQALHDAALQAHETVKKESAVRASLGGTAGGSGMATTLTLAIATWPWLHIVQVGDSRCYHFCDGTLHQITRDQTLVQGLIDAGVMTRKTARLSPFSNVLASAIGGGEALPVVTRIDIRERGCVVFLCSDGLTAHVSDDEIETALRTMKTSEQACRDLLALALERGGTDNITVVAGRARKA